MSGIRRIDLGVPSLLEFQGPDAVRFLNGQMTQDVRKVVGGKVSLPACVTDAKGKLQFRITVTALKDDTLWIAGDEGSASEIEARLTRYLIADDVEPSDLTGSWRLMHFTGVTPDAPAGVISREANRFGVNGTDWWIPIDSSIEYPSEFALMEGDELETFRIGHGVPLWGKELRQGMLPPEALLEVTDISYNKGCYIGQEVISRVKSAGKVNKLLTRFVLDSGWIVEPGPLENGTGEITSISPDADGDLRHALGYVKRGASDLHVRLQDGSIHPVRTFGAV